MGELCYEVVLFWLRSLYASYMITWFVGVLMLSTLARNQQGQAWSSGVIRT